jgi:hypothetical protein
MCHIDDMAAYAQRQGFGIMPKFSLILGHLRERFPRFRASFALDFRSAAQIKQTESLCTIVGMTASAMCASADHNLRFSARLIDWEPTLFGTVKTRIMGHPGAVGQGHRNVACLEPLLNGNCWAMRQDPKTVAVLFAPHTQQLTILDVSHMTCATPPKLPRTPRVHPGIVIAATLLAGLLSLGIR